jgi:hypothetical protein
MGEICVYFGWREREKQRKTHFIKEAVMVIGACLTKLNSYFSKFFRRSGDPDP